MKKSLLLILLLSFVVQFTFSQVTIDSIWIKTNENGLAPDWFTSPDDAAQGPAYAGRERGIAFNPLSKKIFVSTSFGTDVNGDEEFDASNPHIYILDVLTGDTPDGWIDEVFTTGIEYNPDGNPDHGGAYPLNNVTCGSDGQIYACNYSTNSTNTPFKVYRWVHHESEPEVIINYSGIGYAGISGTVSVIGEWNTLAYIYAAPQLSNILLRWKVEGGVIAEDPEIITLKNTSSTGYSPTVSPVTGHNDWIYVQGYADLAPMLYTTAGDTLGQVMFDVPAGGLMGGRTISYKGKIYMAMFSGHNDGGRAYIYDITSHGYNVKNADLVGYTPSIGVRYADAYRNGSVDLGIKNDELYVFLSDPANGIACFRIDGLEDLAVEKLVTNEYDLSLYPNPVNDMATIKFTLPHDARGFVSVKIFDLSGRFLALYPGDALPGEQRLEINASDFAAGAYTYQVIYDNKISVGKFIKE